MATAGDHFALDWIRSDLIETLNEARAALDDYAEEHQETRLRACLTSLHQVHGTLVMLELRGVTLLADHLEQLAQALMADIVDDPAAAGQYLMQGILELPGYIGELQRGAPDDPAPFLPLVNDIRKQLMQELLADRAGTSLSGAASDDTVEKFQRIDGPAKVARLRSAYQNVLLSILKGEERGAALQTLRKIAVGLERLSLSAPLARQWQAFGEFIVSLSNQQGALESEAVKLLRRVDLEIKHFAKEGKAALSRPVNVGLVQQLLEACVSRYHSSETLEDLQAAIDRELNSSTLAISGRQAVSSAAGALREELAAVKNQLDLLVRAQSVDLGELQRIVAPLKQIGSALSLLAFESSREIVTDQVRTIEQLVELGDSDPDSLQIVAGALVQIDENLHSAVVGSSQTEVEQITSDAQLQVLRESRNGLEQVKQGVVDFVTTHWDVRHLQSLPETLSGICGALRIVPLQRAIALLEQSRDYIVNRLMQGHRPEWQELDTFADVLSGVDYYLERLAGESAAGAEDVLVIAEGGAARLDVSSPETEKPEAEAPELEAYEPDTLESEAVQLESPEPVDPGPSAEPVEDEPAGADPLAEDVSEFAGTEEVIDEAELPVQAPSVPESGAATAGDASVKDTADEAPEVEPPDAEIVEIFVEEVDEVLESIDQWLPQWAEDLASNEALTEVRRSFHTLKGSGRIVQADRIGDLAWGVENMLNRVMESTVTPTAQFVEVVTRARQLIPALRDAFERGEAAETAAIDQIVEQADVLASGGELGADRHQRHDVAQVPTVTAESADQPAEDEDALALFIAEAREHISVVKLENAQEPWSITEAMARAFHTLAGSAAMAEIESVQLIAAPALQVVEAFRSRSPNEELRSFFIDAVVHLQGALDAMQAQAEFDQPVEFVAAADDLIAAGTGKGPTALDKLRSAPAMEQLFEAESCFAQFGDGDAQGLTPLMGALAELLLLVEDLDEPAVSELVAALLGGMTQAHQAGSASTGSLRIMSDAYESLVSQMNALVVGGRPESAQDDIDKLIGLEVHAGEETAEAPVEFSVADVDVESFADAAPVRPPPEQRDETADAALGTEVQRPVKPKSAAPLAGPAMVATENLPLSDIDLDLVQVFFEEAEEISEDLEASILSWSQETENRIHMENMLRGLHTLKGGARLCGLSKLGDSAHDFESIVIEVQGEERDVDDALFTLLHQRYDDIVGRLSAIKEAVSNPQPSAADPIEHADSPPTGAISAPPDASDPGENAVESAPLPAERSHQEMVRVGSALLEELVNLAGENSILRARIEQGMSDFTGALDEMEITIERLREQLRRLEIETETQILFRHERTEGPEYENFDPLEMDRYSHLQQLSRGLSESASDMLDLKDTLLFKARESETLLLQQARINTELQEGLMRTRMVPFSRLMPRLRRIVRQVSAEVGKQIDFEVQNAEGELDRNLLERMVAPLEHMLRNAVDHGIESGEMRRNFGKSATGRIDLRLLREGGDVVIEISDDGAGIDVEGVRAKAIERGLMAADSNLSDEEVQQFILAPGFSTAKSVTQISGRGVGMDVVHSEVKQLGGSIQIASRTGQGARFIVRVPFTVSVNRALMVSVAEDLYAIPLNTIEGIVLLNPQQLADLYAGEGKSFEYAGVQYRVRYLGQYLGREYHVSPAGQSSVPVVLVRSGEQAVAIHVDTVQGSREIVVKSLGPQFAGVGGISGATILGDGSVVVILDLLALIRAQHHQGRRRAPSAPAKGRPRCVMVVDDSVTVRKVTSRLLERQGMDVLVAKDGVEAVALLQERRPDIMLLDIEMPRMDGFEVARQVRHDDRLDSLPIVMISSRTGDKHKEHATQLGVNKFLGKPFQENELLATIDELVTRI